jgi:hypothetical protein
VRFTAVMSWVVMSVIGQTQSAGEGFSSASPSIAGLDDGDDEFWPARGVCVIWMSWLITTVNPMTETTSPARLIQSPAFIFTGASTLIIDRGRAMFTLFLGDTTLGAECDRRASAEPLSGITTSYQPDGRTGDRASARRYAAVPGRSARCGAYC